MKEELCSRWSEQIFLIGTGFLLLGQSIEICPNVLCVQLGSEAGSFLMGLDLVLAVCYPVLYVFNKAVE